MTGAPYGIAKQGKAAKIAETLARNAAPRPVRASTMTSAMTTIVPCPGLRRRVADLVRLVVSGAAMLGALGGPPVVPVDAQVAFARGSAVPRAVQEFAWRVIETHCHYQSYERDRRWFWAYDTRARKVDAGIVYSIGVVVDLPWRKREPSAFIEMTIVDDGAVRLTALKSSFINCSL